MGCGYNPSLHWDGCPHCPQKSSHQGLGSSLLHISLSNLIEFYPRTQWNSASWDYIQPFSNCILYFKKLHSFIFQLVINNSSCYLLSTYYVQKRCAKGFRQFLNSLQSTHHYFHLINETLRSQFIQRHIASCKRNIQAVHRCCPIPKLMPVTSHSTASQSQNMQYLFILSYFIYKLNKIFLRR